MKKWNARVSLLSMLMATLVLTGCGAAGAQELRLGTAGTGGTYYAYGAAMSELVGEKLPDMLLTVKATAGSAANLRLLSEDYLQLAIAQSDLMNDAYYGTGVFAGQEPRTGCGAVAGLYTEPCQIVVRADSGIETVEDLAGRIVGVGEEESGVVENARQILLCCGLSFDMLEVRYLSYSDAALALADGSIDAFFCTAGAPTNAVANLARQTPIRLLGLEERQRERLIDTYGAYLPCTVPAGTYEGQTEEIETVGVEAVLLASAKLSEQQVYDLTAALFENADALQLGTAADTPLELSEAGGVTIPYHPGAARYYTENGIAVETEGKA